MVSGEIGPEQVSGTVECARTCRTAAAASLRCLLREGTAGCSLVSCSLVSCSLVSCSLGWVLGDGLVVAAGSAVAVFVGLAAAAALLDAADAGGAAASPMSATATTTMPDRRPRMPRLARPPPTEVCWLAPLALRFVTRIATPAPGTVFIIYLTIVHIFWYKLTIAP